MEELIFQKVQKGDMIFTLEKDRRSGYPIFDQARVLKVGESKPMAANGKEGFVNSIELVIQDSVSQLTLYLPTNVNEGIYNGPIIRPILIISLMKYQCRNKML